MQKQLLVIRAQINVLTEQVDQAKTFLSKLKAYIDVVQFFGTSPVFFPEIRFEAKPN